MNVVRSLRERTGRGVDRLRRWEMRVVDSLRESRFCSRSEQTTLGVHSRSEWTTFAARGLVRR